MTISNTSKNAHVDQSAPTKPPFLTPGDITLEVLQNWEMGCRQFIKHKEVAAEEQVGKVVWGMQEPSIQELYLNDQECINRLTFEDYMAEVHIYWLPLDWANITHHKMLSLNQGDKPFNEWAVEVQTLNTLLHGTTLHLSETDLHYHLEAHMHADLKVRLLDKKHLHLLNKQNEAVEAALCAECACNGDKRLTSSSQYNMKAGRNTTRKTGTFMCIPPLTDEECTLLRDNNSCFKCREPFAGHTSATCNKGFPDSVTYKTITLAAITTKKGKKMSHTIVLVDTENTVAVVILSVALGDGTDSNKCVAPLTTPLLHWDCLVDGPTVSSPIHVLVLIDDGSAAVLIDESLTLKLGLCVHKLPKSVPFNITLSGNKKEAFLLLDYVKLACTSLDSCYTSCTVHAIMAPNLCTPLLLGGPFLHHNKITIDHENHTCLVKDMNYNLLCPVMPAKPLLVPLPPQMHEMRLDIICELKHILPEYKTLVDDSCDEVNGINLIAAVCEHITTLATEESL
ncbi:uncharacterized protein BJ212DRAFT_1304812 [Suillus subaureus]|uniref:Uncharacterized protein n=1 Tax=Suillus subaureus TaxID=48587 RepID=A0A9P7J4R5_9AGAM|nr:uncharacterized protein BJ212DRAFT_1304812 [Suillus subaureus]KAG1802447.1 hypothetical protein BJ212DRAFT_1304812 [Suillus subaureus]